MKRILFLGISLVLLARIALATALVVTKKEKGIWVDSSRVDGSTLYYMTASSDTEQSMSMSEVDVVIPSVDRGGTYSPEEIDSALAIVRRAQGYHPTLAKQLVVVQQQWEAVKNPDTETGSKITALAAKFDAGAKTPDRFRDICIQLDMIRFKDVLGQYSNQVAAAVEKMQAEFFRVNKTKLDSMLSTGGFTVGNCVACSKLAGDMKACYLSEEQKKALDDALGGHIDATVIGVCKTAMLPFNKSRTIDSYMMSRTSLDDLRRQMKDVERARTGVDRFMKSLKTSASLVFTNYEFTAKGYLMSADDNRALGGNAGTRKFASSVPVSGMQLDEQCYVFPLKTPPVVRQGMTLNLPMRLVFNCVQPPNRTYAMVAEIQAGGQRYSPMIWQIPRPAIRDGHADINFQASMPMWEGGEGGGGATVLLYLAFRSVADDMDGRGWTAASLGCQIPAR